MQRIPPPTQALINQEMQWALGKNPENPNWEQSPQKRSSQARIAQGVSAKSTHMLEPGLCVFGWSSALQQIPLFPVLPR